MFATRHALVWMEQTDSIERSATTRHLYVLRAS